MDTATRLVTQLLTAAFDAHDLTTAVAAADVLNHPSIFPNHPYGTIDAELVGLLRATLDRLDPTDARPLAVLAARHHHRARRQPRRGRRRRSAWPPSAARADGDPGVLARALHARSFALKHRAGVEERLATADEIRRLGEDADLGDELALLADLQGALAEFSLGRFERPRRSVGPVPGPGRPSHGRGRPVAAHLLPVAPRLRPRPPRRGRGPGADGHRRTLISRPREAPGFRLAQRVMVAYDLGGLDDDLLTTVAAIPRRPTATAARCAPTPRWR